MLVFFIFFFFNDTATTEIYTLSLHDALPISPGRLGSRTSCSHDETRASDPRGPDLRSARADDRAHEAPGSGPLPRSEEHTSELQSRQYLVCRLLLEKKKKNHLGT